jgi:hypothetical protein
MRSVFVTRLILVRYPYNPRHHIPHMPVRGMSTISGQPSNQDTPIAVPSSARSTLHQPLHAAVSEVRLLELHPGDHDQEIRCTLHHHRLDVSTSYEALSYTWGYQQDKVPISIGNNPFEVTVDLAAALRRFRDRQTSRLLWIDQICINQTDFAERNAQVSLMRRIYESAARVIVWLGEEDESSNMAMAFIQQHEATVDGCLQDNQSDHLHRIFNEPSYKTGLEAIVQTTIIKPYFDRYWIIQEIVLARDAIVYCGSRSASWRAVMQFMKGILGYNPGLVDTARNDLSPIGYMSQRLSDLQERRQKEPTLLFEPWQLVHWFRYCKATVPSDRIYSWLGICGQWRQAGFKIDYNRHDHDTFKLFTRAMIEHNQDLSWLSHAGSPRRFATLPSWVPDLELPIGVKADPLVLEKGAYSADRGSAVSLQLSPDSSSLFCSGVRIDRISFVTRTVDEVIGICFCGRLDPSSTPAELIRAAASRYGDALRFELECLFTAKRMTPKDQNTVSVVSLLSMVHRAGSVSSRHMPNINAMRLLGESTIGMRAAFVSETGHVGLVPQFAQVGDVVCVLFGSEVPVVLRKDGDHYRFVGDW